MINNLLDKLQKVRTTKHNEWVACCPVHDDHTPSLGIKLTDDGKILCKCFGCQAGGPEVIQAVGMNISDLFPPSPENENYTRQKRTLISAETILKVLAYEANIISLAACDIANGAPIGKDDAKRILLANERIRNALEYTK